MEAVLENLSNFSSTTSNQSLRNPGFAAFLIVIAIPLVAVIVFNDLIAIVLLQSTSVAVTVRVPPIILSLAATRAIALLMCIHVLAPPISGIQYVDDVWSSVC